MSNEKLDFPNFDFPYSPYEIQLQFARNLYNTLSNKKFSIFESPTGTGKSLSIIMGACEWLVNHEKNENYLATLNQINFPISSKDKIINNDLPDWLNEDFGIDLRKQQINKNLKEINEKIEKKKKDYDLFLKDKILSNNYKKYQRNKEKKSDDDLLDYESEKEEDVDKIFELFYKKRAIIEPSKINNAKNEEENDFSNIKIIYATRTHSQIKQFVQEIKKTKYKNLRVITLGSRINLCINDQIKKSNDLNKINSNCKKAKTASSSSDKEKILKCIYYENSQKEILSYMFYKTITDIEDMAKLGKLNQACPYYISKNSVSDAQIICIPYVSLIHEKIRKKFNISLKNSIIIFDEAHNLLESISQLNSFSISFGTLTQIHFNLIKYLEKYKNKLKAKNAFYIQQMCIFTKNLLDFLQIKQKNNQKNYLKMRILDFLLEINGGNIDFYKLEKFVENSNLSKKLNMFNEKNNFELNLNKNSLDTDSFNEELKEIKKLKDLNVLDRFIDFFISLIQTNDSESSFFLKFEEKLIDCSINLMYLDTKNKLKKICLESLSMVLAGGTMEPISEFDCIYDIIPENKIYKFSCGHIIKDSQFKAIIMKNYDNNTFLFNHLNKDNENMIKNLINLIILICENTPKGIIVFLQSYSFLKIVITVMEKLKLNEKIAKKKIFFDSKLNTNLISDYEKCIKDSESGALLISVVGGRLSEGINFNDDLARAILVVGLPYPNIYAPEIIEKMKFQDQISKNSKKNFNGQVLLENLCMKAVNQSIGRAIRHKNDYAIVYLIDNRFSNENIKKKLPDWIKKSLIESNGNSKELIDQINNFYKEMK